MTVKSFRKLTQMLECFLKALSLVGSITLYILSAIKHKVDDRLVLVQ